LRSAWSWIHPIAAALVLAAPTALAGEERRRTADQVLAEMGAELYVQYCASCHGDEARGDGPAAGALKTRPADLTRIAARRDGAFPEGELARFIDGRFALAAHGSREMPVWGERFGERIPEAGVSEEVVRGRIVVLLEYLRSIQRP
jgi:mono/diheme cytochrome c family protein